MMGTGGESSTPWPMALFLGPTHLVSSTLILSTLGIRQGGSRSIFWLKRQVQRAQILESKELERKLEPTNTPPALVGLPDHGARVMGPQASHKKQEVLLTLPSLVFQLETKARCGDLPLIPASRLSALVQRSLLLTHHCGGNFTKRIHLGGEKKVIGMLT